MFFRAISTADLPPTYRFHAHSLPADLHMTAIPGERGDFPVAKRQTKQYGSCLKEEYGEVYIYPIDIDFPSHLTTPIPIHR